MGIRPQLGEDGSQRITALRPVPFEQQSLGFFEVLLALRPLLGDPLCRVLRPDPLPGLVNPIGHDHGHDDRRAQADQRGRRRMPPHPLRGPLPARGPAGADRAVVEESAEVVGQLQGRAVTPLRLLLEALQADRLEVRAIHD